MGRLLPLGVLVGALAARGLGAEVPWGATRKSHPTTAALRDYTATLRTNLGDIPLELLPDAAPNAVRVFVKLAQRGAYDGARFHCVFKDRMALASAPPAKGKDEVREALAYESTRLSANAGAVLMDRASDGKNRPDRLMIMLSDQTHLDRDYTVFAEVAKGRGMEVLKQLSAVATKSYDGAPVPIEDVVIEQVIVAKKPTPGAKEASPN